MVRFKPDRNGPKLEEFGGQMEEKVLDKQKVKGSKREAFRGRGAPWNGEGCAKTRNTE